MLPEADSTARVSPPIITKTPSIPIPTGADHSDSGQLTVNETISADTEMKLLAVDKLTVKNEAVGDPVMIYIDPVSRMLQAAGDPPPAATQPPQRSSNFTSTA